jgi:PAS domain S-box-containing protein
VFLGPVAAGLVGGGVLGLVLPALLAVSAHLPALLLAVAGAGLGLWLALGQERGRLDRALAAQRHLLEALLEAVPLPIFYKDREGRYLGCNTAFERFMHRRRDQLIGRTVVELGLETFTERYAQRERDLLERAGTDRYEWVVETPDGPREVEFHKATFTGKGGELAGLVGVAMDLTDQRRAQGALDRTRATHELLFGPGSALELLTLNRGGEVLSISPSLAAALGRDSEALPGQPAASLFTVPEDLVPLLALEPGAAPHHLSVFFAGASGPRRTAVTVVPDGVRLHLVVSDLSGDAFFITICMGCHRIREGDARTGLWGGPADYFYAHEREIKDPARPFAFTHGLCPDCVEAYGAAA